jgi:hypothetical protein
VACCGSFGLETDGLRYTYTRRRLHRSTFLHHHALRPTFFFRWLLEVTVTPPVVGAWEVGMKTDRIRTDITDIVFVFIFMFGFGFEYR